MKRMATNLKLLRLSTGEEIIGEVVNENVTKITIKNPVRVLMVPSKADPNNPTVAFAPFMQWSDDKELTLNANHVTVTATPITEFVNQYNSMFGGIVVPNSKLITP
jgi:hypothetical protein